jgi:cytoskeletal protein RodZ
MDFGCYLKSARERKHVTLETVSASTKIKPQLWIDLEANDLSRWPKYHVYRQGYLRSYANVVGIDPDDVIARFNAEFAAETAPPAVPARQNAASSSRLKTTRDAVALAIATAFLVGVGLNIMEKREIAGAATSASTPIVQVPAANPRPASDHAVRLPTPSSSDPTSGSPTEPSNRDVSVADAPRTDIEGEIRVLSNPAGAWVTVNGNGAGTTPLRLRYLPLGSYTVRVIQPRYRIAQTRVTLSAAQPNQSVSLRLREDTESTDSLDPGPAKEPQSTP